MGDNDRLYQRIRTPDRKSSEKLDCSIPYFLRCTKPSDGYFVLFRGLKVLKSKEAQAAIH